MSECFKICLVGTGSTHKTTTAIKLSKYFKSGYVLEYGKYYVDAVLNKNLIELKQKDFNYIIPIHRANIINAILKYKLIIMDTDFLTSWFWCLKYFGSFNNDLLKYRITPDVYIFLGQEGAKYKKDFCNNYENHNPKEEIELYNFIRSNYLGDIHYVSGDNRFEQCKKIINNYRRSK